MSKEIEQEIQEKGLTAPRVTPEHIESIIASEEYYRLDNTTVTIALLTLQNGFSVTGESACASPENFDEEIGRKIARANAKEKLWALEGYLLKQRLYETKYSLGDDVTFIEHIARTAHEVNKAYCNSIGDNSQPTWNDAPEWQKSSAINGVKFHISNPKAGADHSHNNWLKEKVADGWKWGQVKDADKKEHPCFVPYEGLPAEQKSKDFIFRGVVHALS